MAQQFEQGPAPSQAEFDELNSNLAHFGSSVKTLTFSATTDANGNVYNNTLKPANHVILGALANGDKACTIFLDGGSTGFNYHISSYSNWNLPSTFVTVTVYYVDK
jgi:hypothetical protein